MLWNNVLSREEIGHGKEGYYFAENGEHKLYDVAQRMGAVLKDLGLADTDEPSTFTQEELDKYFDGVRMIIPYLRLGLPDTSCHPVV